MAAFMVGKSLKARRQNEAIGKLFDEAGMVVFPNWPADLEQNYCTGAGKKASYGLREIK